MGFAAGFAAGYEAVDKGRREEAARKKQIDDEAKKLKEEQDKVFNSAGQEIASHNKLVSDLTINMAKAEDETQYNTYASELKAANDNFTSLKAAKLDNYKDTPLAVSLDKLYSNARMSSAEQVVQTDIKDYNGKPVTVYLPESIANNKDSAILMENGKVGLAGDNNIGADGKITGYNPTNITPIKFKPTTDKYTKGLELFTPGGDSVKAYSPDEAKQYEQQGFGRVKPKIDSSPRVEVKIDNMSKEGEFLATKRAEVSPLVEKVANGETLTASEQKIVNDNSAILYDKADTKDRDIVRDLNKGLLTEKKIESITNKFYALNESLKKNNTSSQLATATAKLSSYFGTDSKIGELAGMTPDEIKKVMQVDTSSAILISQYAKDMTGLSATNDLMKRYKDDIVGGDWTSFESKAIKSKQYLDELKQSNFELAKSASRHDPSVAVNYYKEYNKGKSKDTKTENPTPPKAKEIIQNGWVYDAETKKPLRKVQ